MLFRSLSALWRPCRKCAVPVARKRATIRLAVEPLEDRAVPALLAPVLTPDSGAVGEYTGDGLPDLVRVRPTTLSLETRPGLGDGRFGAPVVSAAAGGPAILVSGDFNNDGRRDVITGPKATGISPAGATPKLHLGRGDGTFAAGQAGAGGRQPVLAADLNNDGKLDLLASYTLSYPTRVGMGVGTVWVVEAHPGNGDGTFRAPVPVHSGGSGGALHAGDFNGDGNTDLLAVPTLSTSLVYLGNGDATFRRQSAGFGSVATTGDFNGDGRTDVITYSSSWGGTPVTTTRLGRADGTFTAVASGLPHVPHSAAVGDLNGDGIMDLATHAGRSRSDVLYVHLGNGDGTFGAGQEFHVGLPVPPNVSAPYWTVGLADFDADGRLDAYAIGHLGSEGTAVLFNDGAW